MSMDRIIQADPPPNLMRINWGVSTIYEGPIAYLNLIIAYLRDNSKLDGWVTCTEAHNFAGTTAHSSLSIVHINSRI